MPTILILEDSHERIEQFINHFQNRGFTLLITDEADRAIDLLNQRKIDLVFLDHDLGDANVCKLTGLHVAQAIAKMTTNKPPTAIIHSLNAPGAKAMQEALGSTPGTVAYISPFPICFTQFNFK